MNGFSPSRILAWGLLVVLAPFVLAQDKPLERSFSAGASASYRIQLTVRSEVTGHETQRIGVKTYVKPFSRAADYSLAWTATRRVVSVDPVGTAEIEETLEDFGRLGLSSTPEDPEAAKLAGALREACGKWGVARVLRYRETPAGQLLGLASDGVPLLDEELPRVLSLWLLRALRPTAALPVAAIRFREPWQEPRAVRLPNWGEASGSESGEWLEANESSEPAVRLHLVQQISGTVASGAEKPPEGTAQAHFYGESLNTVSLGDARLLAAVRSATREITWTLAPVEGLPERPQFRGRLSVEVRIEACNEGPCQSAGRSAVRSNR